MLLGYRAALARVAGLAFCVLLCAPTSQAAPVESRAEGITLMDAVALALERDPNIKLSASRLKSAQGSLAIAEGRFDLGFGVDVVARDTETPTGEDASRESRSFTETATWSKTLRSGQELTPSISLNQDSGNPGESTATVSFRVRQPLLKGRRPSVVVAAERAAGHELAAARLDLLHLVGTRLNAVAAGYWTVRAAMLDLGILRDTESRSRELLDNTRRLVAADLTPAADLIQLEADLEFREVSTLTAERTLAQAVERLGATIGLAAEEIEAMPLPVDPFPSLPASDVPDHSGPYLAVARERRADLTALKERVEAAERRLEAARDDVKPQLDLVLTPSYTGLVAGDGLNDAFLSLSSNIPGVSAVLALSYSLPIGNRVAVGREILQEEAFRRALLEVDRQGITVGTDVLGAMDEVRSNALRREKLERAVELFSRSLENETKKLRAGSSTLIDLLNQRDRLTSAQQRLVSAQLALARALADLRFKTGTLVRPLGDDGIQEVRQEDLTTLPTEEP